MKEVITSIVQFPAFTKGNWMFKVSITNQKNVLIFAAGTKEPFQFLVKFFVNENTAADWAEKLAPGP